MRAIRVCRNRAVATFLLQIASIQLETEPILIAPELHGISHPGVNTDPLRRRIRMREIQPGHCFRAVDQRIDRRVANYRLINVAEASADAKALKRSFGEGIRLYQGSPPFMQLRRGLPVG